MSVWPASNPIQGFFFDRGNNLKDLREKIYPSIPILALKQVHSSKTITVTKPDALDAVEADALVTRLKDVGLTVHTADCLPLLACENEVIGACHAGWRGVRSGVIGGWLSEMMGLGAAAAKIKVAIGPSIGPCHFEVGKDVAEELIIFEGKALPAPWLCKIDLPHPDSSKRFINLETLAVFHLVQSGILERNITKAGRCTFCHPEDYFSFRRDGAKNQRLEALIINSQSR